MNEFKVNYGVIPCAGRGTRFLPITKGSSKEMLNIVDRPTVDYIVDEMLEAGIENIVFIISKEKQDLIKYYTKDKKFEDELVNAKKLEYLKIIKEIPMKANFYFVEQKEMRGLGDAVLCAKKIVKDNNFAVCCGDDIVDYEGYEAPLKEMIRNFKKVKGHTIVGGQTVSLDVMHKYGCVDVKEKISEDLILMKGMVEKPTKEEITSNYASLGKWVFNSHIFEELEHTPLGKGNELQLTDAIALLMKKEDVYYTPFKGVRYDCGDKLGYLKAIVNYALKRDEFKEEFKEYLKEKLK